MSEAESPPNTNPENTEGQPSQPRRRAIVPERLRSLIGSLFKSRLRLALAAGVLLLCLTAGIGAAVWLFRPPPDNLHAQQMLSALNKGDLASVHELADKVLTTQGTLPDDERVALFAQFYAFAKEADTTKGEDRRRLLLLAANYGEQAAVLKFIPGWEEEGAFLLGRCLHYLARFAESRKWLREALKLTANKQARVYWLLAESHLLDPQGQKEEALKFNEAFLQISRLDVPSRDAGWMQRTRIQIALGKPDEAEAALAKLSPQVAKGPDAVFLKAWVEYESGKRLLTDNEELQNKSAKEKLFSAQEKLDQVRKAISAEESLRARATYLLGMVLDCLGDPEKAVTTWERCQTEYPDSYEAWASRLRTAELHQKMAQYDLAGQELVACFRDVSDPRQFFNPWITWPEAQTLVRDALKTYQEKKLYSLAMNVVDSLQKSFPEGEVHELRARVFSAWSETLLEQSKADLSDSLPSVATARRYLRLAGDEFTRLARSRIGTRFYTEDLWQAADHYYRGASYSRASRVYREYLRNEARRRNPIALLRLGECLLAMGRIDESLLVLQECIEFHRKDAASYSARLLAAYAYLEKGLPDKAEEMLLANLSGELAPTSVEWRDSLFALGEMYYQMGRDQDAIPRLEESIRRYPQDPRSVKSQYYLAEIHSRIAWNRMISSYNRQDTPQNSATVRGALLRSLEYYRQVQNTLDSQWGIEEPTEETRKILRNTYFGIGFACYHLGQFNDALAAYTTVTNRFQADPEVLDAYIKIARCRQAMGQPGDVRIALEQARIVLGRLPNETRFDQTTPFTRTEWAARLTKLLQAP